MMPSDFIEFSRPFVDACKNIFTTMVMCNLDAQKPTIKTDNTSRGDITAVIGLSGELEKSGKKTPYKAMLVLSFPYETYFKVASAMLSETYTTYHPDIHDLGSEIVNMIMGNAKRDLKTLGYTSNMAIPSLIEGKGHSLTYPAGTTTVLIPFASAHGPLYMEICYSAD
ncbi:MAG: chemotaxis protein CheX [Bdellovibrionales bacterium]|nr:chemotaxis protein CheX [Bdellovibrionales bacterium]